MSRREFSSAQIVFTVAYGNNKQNHSKAEGVDQLELD